MKQQHAACEVNSLHTHVRENLSSMSFLSRYPARLFLWQPQTAEPGTYPIGAFSALFTRVTASETTRGIPYTPREVLPSKLASRRTDMPPVPSQRTAVIISLWPLPLSQGHTVSHGCHPEWGGEGGTEPPALCGSRRVGSRGAPYPAQPHRGAHVNSRVFLWGLCLLGVPEIRGGPAAENSGQAADTARRWLCVKGWLHENPGGGGHPAL